MIKTHVSIFMIIYLVICGLTSWVVTMLGLVVSIIVGTISANMQLQQERHAQSEEY